MLRRACIYITVAVSAAAIFLIAATAWHEVTTSPFGVPPGW
jgi:hypothetical protein